MFALEQVQQAMMHAIALGPDHVPDTLFAGGRRAALRGLAVHANTISHARLVALEDSFPRTRLLLGETAFNVLSRAFLEAGAGTQTLALIGRNFPVWLAGRDQPPGATDLARFEWTWLQCYHAADSPALSLSELAEIGSDEIADIVLGQVRKRMLAELAETRTPSEAIAAVFDKFIGQTSVPQGNWGCFLVNTALELAAHDGEIAELVNAAHDEIEAFFLAMIRKGQQSGDFDPDRDAKPLAHQALASLLGMLVMIRSRPREEFLTAIRDGVLKTLT